MADMNVVRIGQINNAGVPDALFLKMYAETLVTFERSVQFKDKHYVRKIAAGKSAQFPVIGRGPGARYHTPGAEITGGLIPSNEKVITIDGLLISDVSIAEIDEAMNHYEVRSKYTAKLAEDLAQTYDKNVAAMAILAARSAGWSAGIPGGSVIVEANAKTSGADLADAVFDAGVALDEKDVSEMSRRAFVKPLQYSLLARTTSLINKDWGGAGVYADGSIHRINNIELVKTNNLPTTDVTGTFGNKYNVNAVNTAAIVMNEEAVGTVELLGMKLDTTGFDVKTQATLFVAKMAVGHGILRPECAVEIATL